MRPDNFEPKIIVFVCGWCCAVAVDAAGMEPNPKSSVRIVRVLCSGMVDPGYVIKAFASGADAVLIVGCPEGNCHYISGNVKALRRAMLLKKLLVQLGVDENRFRLEWIAHSEKDRYLKVVNEMSDKVNAMGPITVC
jgi:coenzyme F420-reducing hydrogenase delta subunit